MNKKTNYLRNPAEILVLVPIALYLYSPTVASQFNAGSLTEP
jgi:hypothetical protein